MPPSESWRYRPSDLSTPRFWLWLALSTLGIALWVAGDSLFGRLGIIVFFGSGLIVIPPSEFRRLVRSRDHLFALVFLLFVLALIVATELLHWDSAGIAESWEKALLAISWAVVVAVEWQRFRQSRAPGAA